MFVMACEFSLVSRSGRTLTSARNSAGCRCGRGMNSYPVFRDGSVNCVTYVRKLSEKFFVLENCPKNFSDARSSGVQEAALHPGFDNDKCAGDFVRFSAALPVL
jgi:hypothetical protein